jgi:hypothetical protein
MSVAPQTSSLSQPSAAAAAQLIPALRTAAAAALVAFGLSFPIISYHAESNINNELVLIGRWFWSFVIAAIVFVFVFLRQMANSDWRVWFDRVGAAWAARSFRPRGKGRALRLRLGRVSSRVAILDLPRSASSSSFRSSSSPPSARPGR